MPGLGSSLSVLLSPAMTINELCLTMLAEAAVIPRTVFPFAIWVDVEEWTVFVATHT